MKGNQISKLRKALDLSVVDFATLLGVQTSSIYRWENQGTKVASVEGTAEKILLILEDLKKKERDIVIKHLRKGGWMPAMHSILSMALKKSV